MPHFTPTAEQIACVEAATGSQRNLIINALAGAAKTSTLVLIAEALQGKRIQSIAFNVRIAKEMQERLPMNCTASTLNSVGHRAWGTALGRRLMVNKDKTYQCVSAMIQELDKAEQREAFESFTDIMNGINQAKIQGYVPDNFMADRAKPLMGDDLFFSILPEEPTELVQAMITEGMKRSIKAAYLGEIDYADQLLMPTVFPCNFHQFDVTLVDEAQDLSELNHMMIRKMVKTGRLIAVGDPCQSIYAFRGAHEESMPMLQQSFDMEELHLTTTFRCPINVVKQALWRAPAMKWPEWAKEGEVKMFTEWSEDQLPSSAVILCRNNAPLFSMAIRLLKAGRAPELVGNDIGKGLLKIMKKFGPAELPQKGVLQEIQVWKEEKIKKSRDSASIHDRAECMEVFAYQGKNLGEAIAYAEHVFACGGPIKLMTGHKSKGLEFDNVFLLDTKLLRLDRQQERNLKYVMQTRAKAFLGYIDSDHYIEH